MNTIPDAFGFDHLVIHGQTRVQCIEEGCDATGEVWQWPEKRRQNHFISHRGPSSCSNVLEIVEEDPNDDIITRLRKRLEAKNIVMPTGPLRWMNCQTCGEQFSQERKRGRPKVFCPIHEKV